MQKQSSISSLFHRYSAYLNESADLVSPYRTVVIFLLIVLVFTGIPVSLAKSPGIHLNLLYLYVFFFPLSILIISFLTSLFVHCFFLKLLGVHSRFSVSVNLVFGFARNLMILVVVAGFCGHYCKLSSTGATPFWVKALFMFLSIIALIDLTAHLAAFSKKSIAWSLMALVVFLATFVPGTALLGRYFWSEGVFEIKRINSSMSAAISIPEGSFVVFDKLFWRFQEIERFHPILYKNRGKGGEAWAGRVYGLPNERLELSAGDVFDFNSAEPYTKPEELQEILWIPVEYEGFSGNKLRSGWSSQLGDAAVANGYFNMTCKEKVFLEYLPPADASAYKSETGVTDFLVSKWKKHFKMPDSGNIFLPRASGFKIEHDSIGNLEYWGIDEYANSLFCPRCGQKREDSVIPSEGSCKHCGKPLDDELKEEIPLFKLEGGNNPVYDLKVQFKFILRAQRGMFAFRFYYHDLPVRLLVNCEKRSIHFENSLTNDIFTLSKVIEENVPVTISLSCFDGKVVVDADDQRAVIPVEVDLSMRNPFEFIFDAENTCVAIDSVAIYRDQYFTSSEGLYSLGRHSIVKVPNSSYFLLNDEGQNIQDSRSFGCVSEELIEGMPVFPIWPVKF